MAIFFHGVYIVFAKEGDGPCSTTDAIARVATQSLRRDIVFSHANENVFNILRSCGTAAA